MMRLTFAACLAFAILALAGHMRASIGPIPLRCDRACLENVVDQYLAGKSLREWTNDELRDYCERYNVGWVVCWTDGSAQRFASWQPGAKQVAELQDGGRGRVFAIDRRPAFALVGSARWVRADARHIVLEDVRPERGEVLLSLHYQAGLRVTPGRVRLERATDPRDPIPFVRLVVKEPVARVTIVWDRR